MTATSASGRQGRRERFRVIDGPLAKGPGGHSQNVGHGRSDVRRSPHRRVPRSEQHVHGGGRPGALCLAAELIRLQVHAGHRTSQDLADDLHLFCLAQRLRAGDDVVTTSVPVDGQDPCCDRGDVPVVDGRRLRCAVRPPDFSTGTDRRRHQLSAFDANIPGRMTVISIPDDATRSSICA